MKCPRCRANQGMVELVDNKFKDFFCRSCKLRFPMRQYSGRMKEEEELVIEEVDLDNK